MQHRILFAGFLASTALLSGVGIAVARAENDSSTVDDAAIASQINTLQDEINEKEASIDQINRKIEEYRKKIDQKQNEAISLTNELELIENRLEKTRLDIEANNEEIDSVNGQIRILDTQIAYYEAKLSEDKRLLAAILQRVQAYDNDMTLQLLFGTDSFSELFDRLARLESVSGDLHDTLEKAATTRDLIERSRTDQEGKRARLVSLQEKLSQHMADLENEGGAKESLVVASRQSEAQFQSLVTELRQESTYVEHQISALQGEIEAKLSEADLSGVDSSLLSWPVTPYKGLSTYFHDPTYPFRHLFEHSGIDIPEPQGTPVTSAAPGYVAFTRTANMYGNYVMVIHTNGTATLYAHLSKISVVPDQFVARGDVIGLSGGTPGTPGAGLSTGPHLHFEVRKDGIPVNPLDYLTEQP